MIYDDNNKIILDKTNSKIGRGNEFYSRRLTRQVSMHTLIGTNNLRLNGKLCDATLILDNGDTFPIHRTVLCGSSDYFRLVYLCIKNLLLIVYIYF